MVNSKELRCTDIKWAKWPGKRIYHTLGHFANLLSVFQSQFFSANRSDLMSPPPQNGSANTCVQKKVGDISRNGRRFVIFRVDLIRSCRI